MGKTPTPAHRASAQLHNALRDALACVCASCSSRSCCCACVLAGLLFGLGSCAACWVFCSYLLTCNFFAAVREALCYVVFIHVAMRDHESFEFYGGAAGVSSHWRHCMPSRTSQHAGNEEATEDISTQLAPLHSHTNTKKRSRRQRKYCYAGDVAIVDNHTAVTHASFLVI
jgi:hypothetical protein